MTGREELYMAAVRGIPRRRLSRVVGSWAQLRSRMAVRRFAAALRLDLDEAEFPLGSYPTVESLFTRRLRAGARPVDPRPEVLVAPVDGTLNAAGGASSTLPQAKGRTYTVEALRGGRRAGGRGFEPRSFATFYLSPRDYHRIHAPVSGRIEGWTHIPGDLFPVNRTSVERVDAVFARNERVIVHLESESFGGVDVVMVGATIVGKIYVSHAPELGTNVDHRRAIARHVPPRPVQVEKGEEIGVFGLGSTVILLVERRLRGWPEPGAGVRMGTAVASLTHPRSAGRI
ncbi:MAG: archaetidylserine decarboxylase [Myxococcota bacterium]